MKITRIIDGSTYETELTSSELFEAFREQEFQFDRNDIEDMFNSFSDEELEIEYDMSRKELELLFDDMAMEMRRNMDKYGMSWDYARDDAISTVLYRERV